MQHTKNTIWDILHYLRADKELNRAAKLLSLGSFLEWFDLFLYAHMAVVLNGLFFPVGDSQAQSLLSALAFCSSFIFRPIGALLFGYIGDVYGRKVTVVITTLLMAATCLIMANVPTYNQIGIAAAWIVTFCRILQGMTSMGEITAAQMFLTEATPEPARFPIVGMINISQTAGGLVAIAVGVLATFTGFDWRIAFWVGACIAIVGSIARTYLRESVEYADARKRIESVAKRAGEKLSDKIKENFTKTNIPKASALAYFGIMCSGQVFLYFVYFYCPIILKNSFHYEAHQILVHNLLLAVIELVVFSFLRVYLTTITHPLKILRYNWIALCVIILLTPWLLNHVTAVWHLLAIQVFVLSFRVHDFPAVPIFYNSFPLFKRLTAVSLIYATAYALVYVVTAFGLVYLIHYLGYWGLLVLMVPTLIAYGLGLNYFIQQEAKAGRYPTIDTWPVRESIRKEGDGMGWVKNIKA